MLDEEAGPFSDLIPGDYELMKNEIGITSFELITPDEMKNGPMMAPMMGIIQEESTSMDEYKFINATTYLPSNTLPFPPPEPQDLCTVDYAGPHSFEVFVDPNVMKNPWEYSPSLNKIYIDMKHRFPINFSVKGGTQPLFVRVMPMFEEDRYFQELVHRCICHEQRQDPMNTDVSELIAQHIIRCDNKSAFYFGDKNAGQRLSIVIPLTSPKAGTDSVKEFFYFVCKNSCVGGMNRRPIQVIFTLEDETGCVQGRRVLCVRVCSCPKRDREKEEKRFDKEQHPQGKKRKMEKKVDNENVDSKVFTFTMNVAGKENYKQMAKFGQLLMGNAMSETKNSALSAIFKKCKDEATMLLNQISD